MKFKKWALPSLSVLLMGALALSLLLPQWAEAEEEEGGVSATEKREAALYRVLVVGSDRAAGLDDVMMLCCLDSESGSASVLQIPRDTCVVGENGRCGKINGLSHRLGGYKELCKFLTQSLGVPVTNYVSIDLDGFSKVVDALGGVKVTLPCNMEYRDPDQGLFISLAAGEQLLSGEEAEQFVRYRSGYVRGDLGRMDAQKIFLGGLFERVRELGGADTLRLARALFGEVETDLSLADILRMAGEVRELSLSSVNLMTLPGEDCRSEVSGAWYYTISRSGTRRAVGEYLRCEVSEEDFDPKRSFLYPDRESFSKIYYGEQTSKVYSAEEINKNGVSIDRIR